MRRQRKTYTPEEKVGIIRKHLLDGTAVSDLCDEYGLHPTVYYRWQKEFFEGGAAAFAKESDRQIGELKRRVAEAQAQLSRKNEVLAEVMEEYVRCKKNPALPVADSKPSSSPFHVIGMTVEIGCRQVCLYRPSYSTAGRVRAARPSARLKATHGISRRLKRKTNSLR